MIWELAIDIGIVSALILVSKYIRASVTIVQRLYIPVAMLAGLFGLLLGQYGLDLISFSDAASSYSGLLICVVFACIGLTTKFPSLDVLIHRTGKFWAFNQTVNISQWSLAVFLGVFFFGLIEPGISQAFGLVLPAGFIGGHGMATALGSALVDLGWNDAITLGLLSATIGVFIAVIGGLAIVNIGAHFGYIKNVTKFKDLETHFRKGLIPKAERESIGEETVSSSSINVFTLHVSLIAVVTAAASFAAEFLSSFSEYVSMPTFACAFLIGCFTRYVLKKTKAFEHFDDGLFSFSAGAATDYLIVFGIATIQISVLITYAVPIMILMAFGVSLCLFLVFFMAPRMLGKNWFEIGVFSWGGMTGTVAMGILLLRIVDPNGKSKILDDYAIAYLPGSIVDILLISILPGLIMTGNGGSALMVLLIYLATVISIGFYLNRKKS